MIKIAPINSCVTNLYILSMVFGGSELLKSGLRLIYLMSSTSSNATKLFHFMVVLASIFVFRWFIVGATCV